MTNPNLPPEVVERLRELLAKARTWLPWDAFQSTIQPDRWYVSDGQTGLFATEIGATGENEARLVAEAINALPALLDAITALSLPPAGDALREALEEMTDLAEQLASEVPITSVARARIASARSALQSSEVK